MNTRVPVIMYHSVGIPHSSWIWDFLTIPYALFENHVLYLRKKNFHSIDFMEYYNHVKHGEQLPSNPVFFNFDDGYLDNWVFAYPILKKYGFNGTIFVNPEFVDPVNTLRPNLEDVWHGRLSLNDLQVHGFLSWAEMRKMEEEGIMDIQSHAMTHTWYFSGPNIIDFRHPGDQYVWMDWNEEPEKKWQYLSKNNAEKNQCFGSPVYEHGKSLEVRRYFPDKRLEEHLKSYVSKQGADFFENKNAKEILYKVAKEFSLNNRLQDSYESNSEHFSRLHWELGESKRILESQLLKNVDFLCWPGGGYYPASVEISKQYYLGSTIASKEKKGIYFRLDNGHLRIERIGCPIIYRNGSIEYTNGKYLYHYLREYQKVPLHRTIRRCLKLLKIASRK